MRLVVLALAACLATGFAATASAQTPAEKGAKVYEAQKCSMCHAIAGKGNKKYALDGVGKKLNEHDIRLWIVEPREAEKKFKSTAKPPMKSYKSLPAADVEALVAYLKTLK
jgi:mono/diheme cytochrome c family protein